MNGMEETKEIIRKSKRNFNNKTDYYVFAKTNNKKKSNDYCTYITRKEFQESVV